MSVYINFSCIVFLFHLSCSGFEVLKAKSRVQRLVMFSNGGGNGEVFSKKTGSGPKVALKRQKNPGKNAMKLFSVWFSRWRKKSGVKIKAVR